MHEIGIVARPSEWHVSYIHQFLLDENEASQLQTTLRRHPVELSVDSGRDIPEGLSPGSLPGGILSDFDFGVFESLSRNTPNSWAVRYGQNPIEDLSLHTTLLFNVNSSNEFIFSVSPYLSIDWVLTPEGGEQRVRPERVISGELRGNPFEKLVIEYVRKEKGLLSSFTLGGLGYCGSGLNFVPADSAGALAEEITHMARHVTLEELRQLEAYENFAREIEKERTYGGEQHVQRAKDLAIQALRASYDTTQAEIIRRVRSQPKLSDSETSAA